MPHEAAGHGARLLSRHRPFAGCNSVYQCGPRKLRHRRDQRGGGTNSRSCFSRGRTASDALRPVTLAPHAAGRLAVAEAGREGVMTEDWVSPCLSRTCGGKRCHRAFVCAAQHIFPLACLVNWVSTKQITQHRHDAVVAGWGPGRRSGMRLWVRHPDGSANGR